MKHFAIFVLLISTLCVAPRVALCDDLADLKAAHEQFRKAVNSLDPVGLRAALHDDIVVFLRDNPFPQPKPRADALKATWANVEKNESTMLNPQYVIVGNTGVIIGHIRQVRKPKDGPEETLFSRTSLTFVKTAGKWLLLAAHVSAVPTGN